MEKIYSCVKPVGLIIVILASLSIGINLFIIADLGSDSITVFQQGISLYTGISLGQASLMYNLCFIFLTLLIDHKKLGVLSFVTGFGVGIMGDFVRPFLGFLSNSNVIGSFVILCVAQCMLCFAYALLIEIKMGSSSLDCFILAVEAKTNIRYVWMRWLIELILLTIGLMLNGVIGLGTIISVMTTGKIIDTIRNFIHKTTLLKSNAS